MIQIDKIRMTAPKLPEWKWWQFLVFIVSIILASKVDPAGAFELLERIVSNWIGDP